VSEEKARSKARGMIDLGGLKDLRIAGRAISPADGAARGAGAALIHDPDLLLLDEPFVHWMRSRVSACGWNSPASGQRAPEDGHHGDALDQRDLVPADRVLV